MKNDFFPLRELAISIGIRSKRKFELSCVSRSQATRGVKRGFTGHVTARFFSYPLHDLYTVRSPRGVQVSAPFCLINEKGQGSSESPYFS
jgi:hypothetical protein